MGRGRRHTAGSDHAVEAVACVAEPGDDVRLLVELLVDGRQDDGYVGVGQFFLEWGTLTNLVILLLALFVFFLPNYFAHADNYIPANPLSTPAHIVPEWYFWPFYAILRAFTVDFILPAKLWGVLAMFASILLLFFLPWLDKSPVRSGA